MTSTDFNPGASGPFQVALPFRRNFRLVSRLATAGAILLLIQAAAQACQGAGLPQNARNLYDDPFPTFERTIQGIDGEVETVDEEPILVSSISALPSLWAYEENADWSIGAILGFLGTRGADKISKFGGLQGRVWLVDFLAAEVSGSIHRASFQSGALIAHQYPVQFSAVLFPFPKWEAKPYVTGGGGWYFTTLDYRSTLSSLYPDTRKGVFGGHGGLGVELRHGSASFSVEADYAILNLNANGLKAHDFDYWQVVAGINVLF